MADDAERSHDVRRLRRRQSDVGPLIEWLAVASGNPVDALTAEVTARARWTRLNGARMEERRRHRGSVPGSTVATALINYYGAANLAELRQYSYELNQVGLVGTICSVTSDPDWTGCHVPLLGSAASCRFEPGREIDPVINGAILEAALDRLAEVATSDKQLWNDPVYRLVDLHMDANSLNASFSKEARFAHYALTYDLMPGEMLDWLARHPSNSARNPAPEELPIRSALLPSAQSLYSFSNRLCVGGPATLFAYTEPNGDVTVLLHQRSQQVLTSPGLRSVFPQGFHQHLWNAGQEAAIGTAVLWEFEEELLGRPRNRQCGHAQPRNSTPVRT